MGDNVHILWIENHMQFVGYALEMFLEAHDVKFVPCVIDAQAALAGETYDAVLLDYDLDDGKGTELFASLDALPVRPVIIAVSSHADGNSRLIEAGADAICSKMDFVRIATVLNTEFLKKSAIEHNSSKSSI